MIFWGIGSGDLTSHYPIPFTVAVFLYPSPDIPRLPLVERKELIDMVFDITTYRAPANIQLPEDYQPPSLAISKLYWKGWILLLVLSAFNPKTIGTVLYSVTVDTTVGGYTVKIVSLQ